ncbi:MAG: glycosyltransferase [Pseudomonadota bacterium]|nr:glycosyltransferase [Pseudomonadota bacterium]
MTTHTLSIIIPVRNQPDTLDELLAKLDNQSCPEDCQVEIICVDNNSNDATPGVIKKYNAIYLLETRLGPSFARNSGAAISSGELLWFIDADAFPLTDDFIIQIFDASLNLDDFVGFGGPILLPKKQQNNLIAFADHMACWSDWRMNRGDRQSDFQPTSFICRKSDFDLVGGFNTSLRVLEDWDLQERLKKSQQIKDGPNAPDRPIWFLKSLPVAHHARSTLTRTIKHSWYWGLPSREGWFARSGIPLRKMETPVLRWFFFPALVWFRSKQSFRAGWQVSRWRALFSFPFLLITLSVWAVAVIVGKGQPKDDKFAPL